MAELRKVCKLKTGNGFSLHFFFTFLDMSLILLEDIFKSLLEMKAVNILFSCIQFIVTQL